MTDQELTKISNMIDIAIEKKLQHNEPSKDTKKFMSDFEIKFATLETNFINFNKKLDCLISKVDDLANKMLCKVDAQDKYASKVEFEKLRGKLGIYSVLFPLVVAAVAFLAGKYL